MATEIFAVDPKGLAQIVARKGKEFLLYELWQNGKDEDVTDISITVEKIKGRPRAKFVVIDNSPTGFRKLSDSWTLFAESYKKNDPTKSGRFNLGEKLVIASAIIANEEAIIETTTGTVVFNKNGRFVKRSKRDVGSKIEVTVRMNEQEYAEVCAAVNKILVPPNIKLTFNGQQIKSRKPFLTFSAKLPTEISNEDGDLCRTIRTTNISIYEPQAGEVASIYELSIPIVETGDRFHVDIGQKVPLNIERDNVTPAFLQSVRTYVLNNTYNILSGEDDFTKPWVQKATEDERCIPDAISKMKDERFGSASVIFDPTDLEANNIAVSQDRKLIYGGSLSAAQWVRIKEHKIALPAGQVTPSPKPFSLDGKPLIFVSEDKWTVSMKKVAVFSQELAQLALNVIIDVKITNTPSWRFLATYGPGGPLILNKALLGIKFFDLIDTDQSDIIELLIHEFSHQHASNHLHESFHQAEAKLAGKFWNICINDYDRIMKKVNSIIH